MTGLETVTPMKRIFNFYIAAKLEIRCMSAFLSFLKSENSNS